jgi:hypothetical protein
VRHRSPADRSRPSRTNVHRNDASCVAADAPLSSTRPRYSSPTRS